jgi:hypothetical protein
MKTTTLIALTAIGVAMAAPVSAHHNSPWTEDGIEIGDMLGNHEDAIDGLPTVQNDNMENSSMLDPADSLMPGDIVPQPNGVNIPDDPQGPVNTPNIP